MPLRLQPRGVRVYARGFVQHVLQLGGLLESAMRPAGTGGFWSAHGLHTSTRAQTDIGGCVRAPSGTSQTSQVRRGRGQMQMGYTSDPSGMTRHSPTTLRGCRFLCRCSRCGERGEREHHRERGENSGNPACHEKTVLQDEIQTGSFHREPDVPCVTRACDARMGQDADHSRQRTPALRSRGGRSHRCVLVVLRHQRVDRRDPTSESGSSTSPVPSARIHHSRDQSSS